MDARSKPELTLLKPRLSAKLDDEERKLRTDDEARRIADSARSSYGARLAAIRKQVPVAGEASLLDGLRAAGLDRLSDILLDSTLYGSAFGDRRLVEPKRTPAGPRVGQTLLDLVAELSRENPWSIADTVRFILCDTTPPVALVRFVHMYGDVPRKRTAIIVHPHIDPPLAAEAFRSQRLRRATRSQVRLVEFLESEPGGMSWTMWCERWNDRYPESTKDSRNFKRDAERAWRRLRPGVPLPDPLAESAATVA